MKYYVSDLGKDKRGLNWKVLIKDYPMGSARFLDFVPFIPINQSSEIDARKNSKPTEVAYVHPKPGNKAYLNDIQVSRPHENNGIGSLLLKFIEKWEVNHGINEIFGDISTKDKDHFDKLQHFYKKNEWRFEFFNTSTLKTGSTTVGRVYKKLK